MNSFCRSCEAPIMWATTTRHKAMPLDLLPSPKGNVDLVWIGGEEIALVLGPADALAAQADGHELYASHFVTCPNRDAHRRPRVEVLS